MFNNINEYIHNFLSRIYSLIKSVKLFILAISSTGIKLSKHLVDQISLFNYDKYGAHQIRAIITVDIMKIIRIIIL